MVLQIKTEDNSNIGTCNIESVGGLYLLMVKKLFQCGENQRKADKWALKNNYVILSGKSKRHIIKFFYVNTDN